MAKVISACQKKHLHQQKWCQLNTLELCKMQMVTMLLFGGL